MQVKDTAKNYLQLIFAVLQSVISLMSDKQFLTVTQPFLCRVGIRLDTDVCG